MRTKLLDYLGDGHATVTELQQAIGASQQNVLKHLGILHDAAIVTHIKDGNHGRAPTAQRVGMTNRPRRVRARAVTHALAAALSAHALDWQPGVSRRSATLRPQGSFNRRSLVPWFAVVSTAVTVCQPDAR